MQKLSCNWYSAYAPACESCKQLIRKRIQNLSTALTAFTTTIILYKFFVNNVNNKSHGKAQKPQNPAKTASKAGKPRACSWSEVRSAGKKRLKIDRFEHCAVDKGVAIHRQYVCPLQKQGKKHASWHHQCVGRRTAGAARSP